MNPTVFLAAALLATASPALAAADDAPDPAAVAAARDLLVSSDFEAQMERTAATVMAATLHTVLEQAEAAHGVAIPDDLKRRVRAILDQHRRDLMAAMKPNALEDAAMIYARYFTAADIAEIKRFQTSATGIKMQAVTPMLMAELSQIGMREASRLRPALEASIQSEIQSWAADQRRPASTGS